MTHTKLKPVLLALALLGCAGFGGATGFQQIDGRGSNDLPKPAPHPAAQKAPAPPAAPPASEPSMKPNFVVDAPTTKMARVIAAEAEHHRRALALKWFGRELPSWDKPCVIRFTPEQTGSGASTFTFGKNSAGEPVMNSAQTDLRGDFNNVLAVSLPHEVTHTVFASRFGKPLPRWADEGLSILSESDKEQFNHDQRARELLNAGRGIRLKILLRMTEYPRDTIVLYAQGHSLARFLLTRPATGVAELKKLPHIGELFEAPGADGHRRLIAFVQLGTDGNTAESWANAAEAVYGFKSVDELEEAWLEWLKTSASVLKAPPATAPAPRPVVSNEGHLIRPTELPLKP